MLSGNGVPAVKVHFDHNISGVAQDIKILYDISRQLRERRFQAGCLKMDALRLEFKLDEDGLPVDCWQHMRSEAHDLVEEVYLNYKPFGKLC